MEFPPSSCKCNTDGDGNYVKSCCFNPVIFFICKLCRGTFENAEKLILHKRQHHLLKDLKGIKFIIFEERFVETETDDNTLRSELTSAATIATIRCEIVDNSSDTNLVPPLHQDNNPDPEIDNVIDFTDESEEFKLPNPFVHLRRLTSKEINSYSKPISATKQNQEAKDVDVDVKDQDEICDSTAKQNVSCDKTATIDDRSINKCSDYTSDNVSPHLTESQISRIVQNFEIIHVPNTRSSLSKKLKSKQLELKRRSDATITELTENNKMLTVSSHSIIAFENAHPASPIVSNLGLQAKTSTGSSPEQSKISDPEIQNNCMETQTSGRNQSHLLLYEQNPSAKLLTINENENDDPGSEIPADGEFIVANVMQSSDGIGCVQFVSACAPVNPKKESTTKKLNLNEAVEKQHRGSDIDRLETEKTSESENSNSICISVAADVVSDDEGGPPSPMPVPLDVAPLLTVAEIKTEDKTARQNSNSEVAEQSVEVNTPQISVSLQTEAKTLVKLSPPSISRARPLRNRARINYSENQTCAKCSRDFYTVEELESHEKVCSRNKTTRKREQLRKRRLTLMTISDGTQATHDDFNDTDEIQIIQTAAISSNQNDLVEVKVTGTEGHQDNDFKDVISSISDSEFESSTAQLNLCNKKVITEVILENADTLLTSPKSNLQKNEVADKNNGMKNQNNTNVIQSTAIETEKHENYSDCSLALKDWIMKEKDANPENIILLDPDPFQAEAVTNKEAETPAFVATSENPIKCKLCSKQLTSDLDAKRHLKCCWTKNKTKHVHCPECYKSYSNPSGLQVHRSVKHLKPEERPLSFKCTICSKELSTQGGFKHHMEVHKNPNLKPFICEICGSGFRRKYKLQSHKLSHSEDRPFKCKLCPKTFKNKEHRRSHEAVHVKDSNHHCLPCNKSFKTKDLLQKHSVRTHLKDKWFLCEAEHCDLKFPHKVSMWTHCQKDHKELYLQMAKLSCTVCSKKFMRNSQLERHMFLHGRERPFKCSEEGCNGTFTTKQSLEEHCRKHTGERPYQCDQCGSTFARSTLFYIHLKQHKHPKVRVLCHLCPKTFSRNWELQQHLTFHEKGRQFSCDKCDLKFMSKSNLKGHMKTHERKDASGGLSSSDDSEIETEESTTEESEPDSKRKDEKSAVEVRSCN